jgi:hypothetical protein
VTLTIPAFVAEWQARDFTEAAGAKLHFIGLCDALGVPRPGDRPNYAFEKRVTKTGGGQGFADVWYRDHFAWEYKVKGGDLGAAYRQLLEYREGYCQVNGKWAASAGAVGKAHNFTRTPGGESAID